MKTTVTETEFITTFLNIRPNNFTLDGLSALFNWLEEMEADTGTESELDVIALCCDFSEYENLADFQNDYSDSYENMDDIADHTVVIPVSESAFIIQAF